MGLVTPELGLVFWLIISFGIVLFILTKFAWKPIMKAIKERESSIDDALNSAEKAKQELQKLEANNEILLKKAKQERSKLLKDTYKIKASIIEESKLKAIEQGNNMIELARQEIEQEKIAAINDMKNQVAIFSVEIAEKILKKELLKDEEQKKLIKNMMKDVNFN
jgi:F-type H+-transporting ATPase subunit b